MAEDKHTYDRLYMASETVAAHTLAGAKLTRGLSFLDRDHTVSIESGSVYGAAILMPQLARTAGWTRLLTSKAVLSVLMMIVCIALHANLLKYIAKEEKVMDNFGGQMWLCDFGKEMEHCTGDECTGPGGTKISAARLYSWNAWITRRFVHDSFRQLFPDMQDHIDEVVDPGEYGMESFTCRLLCIVIFIISVYPEMRLCVDMGRLLFFIPSRNESWLELSADGHDEDDADKCIDKVKIKIAGMSHFWKVFNFFVVLVPKTVLLYMTASAGVTFLMETAGINDVIVNSVAMGFLLSLDELVVDALLAKTTDNLTFKCEPYDYQETSEAEFLDANETVKRFNEEMKSDHAQGLGRLLLEIIFIRMMKFYVVILVTGFFVVKYYMEHCEYKGGQWISKPVMEPLTTEFSFTNMFSLFPVPRHKIPYWSMPEPSD